MKKLEGKIALITGGNSGIGLATARLFRAEGATVIITARSAETYAKAREELGREFEVIQADVSKTSDLDRLYAQIRTKHSGLDVIFANAGIANFNPTADTDEAFFDSHFNTNVRGLYFTVQKALPLLRPGSTVVLNASVVASKGFPNSSVYSATKAAVRSFARSWTAEIPVAQTRFNVVSPGPTETPIFGKMNLPNERAHEIAEGLKSSVPAGRFGKAEEIAQAVLFLASSESSFVAGAELLADGGIGSV